MSNLGYTNDVRFLTGKEGKQMKKYLLALGLLVSLTACGGGDSGPGEDPVDEAPVDETPAEEENDAGEEASGTVDVTAAEASYEQSCIGCHGGDLAGGAGPALTNNGLSSDEIYTIIKEGKGGMPAFPNIPDDEAENLALWISEQ